MKTKKRTSSKLLQKFIVLFILIVIGVAAYVLGIKTGILRANASKIPMTIQTINDETRLYTIKAEYPVFGNTLKELNTAIETNVASRIDKFKTQSTENWNDIKKFRTPGDKVWEYPESPFTFLLQWSPQQINKKYVSFVINIEWYTGGANMAQDSLTFNWDVEHNRSITLEDVFPGKENFLQIISDYSAKNLREQFRSNGTEEQYMPNDMIESGTSPKPENFSRFTFDDRTVTLYFPKYQVAPGAYGAQKVVMER